MYEVLKIRGTIARGKVARGYIAARLYRRGSVAHGNGCAVVSRNRYDSSN
jgi:hypothetical protein